MATVLPDHVIEDILARLPAKSAARCRCLSRSWAATLSSNHFADLHHRLAKKRQAGPRILFLHVPPRDGRSRPKVHGWSPDHPGGATLVAAIPQALTRRYRCPIPPLPAEPSDVDRRRRRYNDMVVAPRLVTQQCRGLVVLEAARAGTYHLFSPTTGQIAALPEGRSTAGPGRRALRPRDEAFQNYASFGIGYDVRAMRHKVVRVYYRGCDDGTKKVIPGHAGCEVYVVNGHTGLWRPAAGGAPVEPAGWIKQDERSVFAQGHVHWFAKRRLDSPPQESFIVSFSIGDERFRTISLPPLDTGVHRLLSDQLTELGGRLCLFREVDRKLSRWPRWNDSYIVWLLRGHETGGTWDLHYRINMDTVPREVARFLHRGTVIPVTGTDRVRRIVQIEPRCRFGFKTCAAPENGDLEDILGCHGGLLSNRFFRSGHAALYEESVVSLGQPCEDIIFAMSLVLLKLSTRTLVRLKLVCRSWRAMIEHKDFRKTRRRMAPSGFIF